MQTQEDHSNPIPTLNVDSLKVDLIVIQNTCSEEEESNSETASSKSVKECSLNSETKDVHAIKYKMFKSKRKMHAYIPISSFTTFKTDSTVQDDNSRSGNDTDADDADIRTIYDEEPMAKVLLEKNVYKGKIATKIELTLEDKHNKVFSNDVTGLDDGVAASFQRSQIHKHMPHTQCFKVNRSNIKKLILSPPLSKSLKGKLKAQVDQESQIKMIQVKEMMQDNDLKNSKSKDKGSRSRSQSMNEQSHYKQDKTKTRQNINVKKSEYLQHIVYGGV
ncbi:hypothetical protein Tco_1493794 [Tanacetum coccineum]